MICNSKSKNRNVLFIKQKELLNDTYYFENNKMLDKFVNWTFNYSCLFEAMA